MLYNRTALPLEVAAMPKKCSCDETFLWKHPSVNDNKLYLLATYKAFILLGCRGLATG
jgi:hypothetical protein